MLPTTQQAPVTRGYPRWPVGSHKVATIVGFPMTPSLSPKRRRVLQSVLYEVFATMLVAPVLWWLFGRSPLSTLALTVLLSLIALAFNFTFNALFEAWEARQVSGQRTWQRRAVHGIGFEIGLGLIVVPVMAWWLDIGLWEALLADVGIMVFFLFYTVVFTWCFDRVFGPPESTLRPAA
ncbi:MAG: putative membrane protein [Hydrogenophaga sp.]|jgi:uncharacterized membrane protein